jgi:hypothetical protein
MKRRVTICVEVQGYHFQHLFYSNLKYIIVNCCLFIYCYYIACLHILRGFIYFPGYIT